MNSLRRISLVVGFFGLMLLQAGEVDPRAVKVDEILAEIVRSHQEGATEGQPRSYELSEEELNAYIAFRLRREPRPGVERVQVRLDDGSIRTLVDVDMDEVEIPSGVTGGLIRSLLSGRQRMEIDGSLQAEDGLATYRVNEARLNSLPLPASLVNSALKSFGEQQNPPFDPTQPFQLPYGIQSIRLQVAKVTLWR